MKVKGRLGCSELDIIALKFLRKMSTTNSKTLGLRRSNFSLVTNLHGTGDFQTKIENREAAMHLSKYLYTYAASTSVMFVLFLQL